MELTITPLKMEQLNQSLFSIYPGVKQQLQSKYTGRPSKGWAIHQTLIQYEGWTCSLSFDWRRIDGELITSNLNLEPKSKAPPESEQLPVDSY
jgi:hypothetical protein